MCDCWVECILFILYPYTNMAWDNVNYLPFSTVMDRVPHEYLSSWVRSPKWSTYMIEQALAGSLSTSSFDSLSSGFLGIPDTNGSYL